MSVEIKGQQIKRACASLREMSADSSSRFATKLRRRINGDGFARDTAQEEPDTAQEEPIAHGDQGQGQGSLAAKAKRKSRRKKMEGSTVAPNKKGGWDRDFVYECANRCVPSNLNSDQACLYSIV